MKYIFEVMSLCELSVDVEQKHAQIVSALKSICEPWGLIEGSYPMPSFGKGIIATFQMSKFLGSGIKGDIMYRYRNHLKRSDIDRIYLQFNPKKVDYTNFIRTVATDYIQLFNGNEAYVCEEDLFFEDNSNYRSTNAKFYSFRFCPLTFWNSDICERNTGISIESLKYKIKDKVAKVETLNNGLLIVLSLDFLDATKANSIDAELKALIGINRPV